ncbi:MAG TPA: hypothetical protein VI461_11285, partial [Chitinophagaceae bacterium]|nr:hypothetical protein [Chitinophagaceae bacterium]
MKVIRNILYFLGVLLLLQAIKALLGKSGFVSYFFWAMILSCLQYLLIAGSILILLVAWLFQKKFSGKKKWMVSGGIVLAIFIGLESLFTFWLNHPKYIPGFMESSYKFYYDSYDRRVIQFERDHAGYDSSLFYKLKQSAVFNYKNREFDNAFITNSLGTRDDENSLLAPEVICLGDSYIMGWGVDQQESVPQQLEKLSGMKVLNAGISSYGTAREMILLNKINTSALTFLIIQYCENDTQENDAYRNN